MGRQIIAKFPKEKQTGVERRIQEAAHDHREIDKKIRKKEEVSLCVTSYWISILNKCLAASIT